MIPVTERDVEETENGETVPVDEVVPSRTQPEGQGSLPPRGHGLVCCVTPLIPGSSD